LAQFYARTTALDVVIARVFNLSIRGQSKILFYGRCEALIGAYKTNKIASMEFGNLGSQRDYINEDLAIEQLLAIAKTGISGDVYNVGSGVPRTMRAILNEMLCKEGIPTDIVVEKSSESVGRKGIDVPLIYADIAKVNILLQNLDS
jgi:GDP-4-dehydro-6-deoxy-D-mannose reductase